MKPILFNIDMVRAILAGCKSATRRVAFPGKDLREFPRKENPDGWWFRGRVYRNWNDVMREPQGVMSLCKYRPGDILYVRETWAPMYPDMTSNEIVGYLFKADRNFYGKEYAAKYDRQYPGGADWTWPMRWSPSIHMPREAARIFLRVTKVRVERLQDITEEQARAEGVSPVMVTTDVEKPDSEKEWHEWFPALPGFIGLWDSTLKKANLPLYGWDANPWVFVISFERISKDEALQ